ncbi:MAG: hypothetical protein RLN88_00950 [Ekhidna sp.]|uniref:hypothetical protein n=1 Tax=Ekhidna sp. TaxID=2608089 RepID=UPI0032EC6ACE
MKKVILSFCAVTLFAFTASAQFHFEFGLNGNLPQGDAADTYSFGAGVYLEPRYAMSDNLDVGLLIGFNGLAGGDINSVGTANTEVSAAAVVPVLGTGTYRFSGNKVSPYAGAGIGLYFVKTGEASVSGMVVAESATESEFGFAPRAGVFIGRLNLGVAYNIAGDLKYMQFNLGVRILGRG